MTGFARQSADTAAGTLTWELRAVNHRFLEVQFRLPDDLRPHEQAFKQQAASVLRRGKVDCALHFNRTFSQQGELKLNPDMVDLLRTRVTEIQNALPNATSPGALDILRWPGVISEPELDAEPLAIDAKQLLEAALQATWARLPPPAAGYSSEINQLLGPWLASVAGRLDAGEAGAHSPGTRSASRHPSACSKISPISSNHRPRALRSSCTPVTPSRVPETLKSISPKTSSSPRI